MQNNSTTTKNNAFNNKYSANNKLKQNINNTKIEPKTNNNKQDLPSSRNTKQMKKAIRTYPTMSNRKFNPDQFKKELESFKEWDNKKKEHLKRLEKEQKEKEMKLLKNPTINTEAYLKFNINPKNYNAVERLYTQDLIRREEKKIGKGEKIPDEMAKKIIEENFSKY